MHALLEGGFEWVLGHPVARDQHFAFKRAANYHHPKMAFAAVARMLVGLILHFENSGIKRLLQGLFNPVFSCHKRYSITNGCPAGG